MSTEASHTITLPNFPPQCTPDRPGSSQPFQLVDEWIAKLSPILADNNIDALSTVFLPTCWWRDMLVLSWDFRTLKDLENVRAYLAENLANSELFKIRPRTTGKFKPTIQSPVEGIRWIESMLDFETRVGRGTGVVRLAQDSNAEWKAYMMYTALKELKGFEAESGLRRPHAGSNSLVGVAVNGNWQERREREREFLDEEPTVLVIGAGQAGLSIGARFQQLGVSTLILDKNQRIGDGWRDRYRTLVTHDPVHYCHIAALPFPSNWPTFKPKDKLGDWFESYASIMELNVWLSTTLVSAEYNDYTRVWTTAQTSHSPPPFCTGHAGEAKKPTFPGEDDFKGQVHHGSEHKDASLQGNLQGKKVVVVGSGNRGHDISQNYYENGAEVTMLQRRGKYEEGGPPTEDADVYGQGMPNPVQFALGVYGTKRITAAEKETLDGLVNVGFALDFGIDGSGIYRKYITRGGGYYIDVGCSQLLIDAKIKTKQSPGGIRNFVEHGIVLADGSKLVADIAVLATGYDNMRTSVRRIMGDKVASRCKDVWDLDEQGEVNAMWRDSGHPGFWYMGGSLALCRIYSKFLALQIKAILECIQ